MTMRGRHSYNKRQKSASPMSYSLRFKLGGRPSFARSPHVLQVSVGEHGDKESKDLAARSPVLPTVRPELCKSFRGSHSFR